MVVELPELEPLEPEPMLPLELPAPVLGEVVLGEVVLGEAGLGEVVALPLLLPVPPVPALEPDLLKWASHSEREIWPSLFVSTAEKFGADALLALLPDMPPLDDEDDVPALPPDAAGDDEDLSLLVPDEELCARVTLDSANSAAAVAALRIFRFNMP